MHFECIMKTGKKECPLCMMTLKLTKEEQQQFKKHNKNKRMEIRGENIIERYRIESERFRSFLDEELGGNESLTWNNRNERRIEQYRIETERFRSFLDEELGGDGLLTWNNRMMASLSFISQFQNSFRI